MPVVRFVEQNLENLTTIRPKARIDFSLSVLNMLWWALGVNHRPT